MSDTELEVESNISKLDKKKLHLTYGPSYNDAETFKSVSDLPVGAEGYRVKTQMCGICASLPAATLNRELEIICSFHTETSFVNGE